MALPHTVYEPPPSYEEIYSPSIDHQRLPPSYAVRDQQAGPGHYNIDTEQLFSENHDHPSPRRTYTFRSYRPLVPTCLRNFIRNEDDQWLTSSPLSCCFILTFVFIICFVIALGFNHKFEILSSHDCRITKPYQHPLLSWIRLNKTLNQSNVLSHTQDKRKPSLRKWHFRMMATHLLLRTTSSSVQVSIINVYHRLMLLEVNLDITSSVLAPTISR
ncbi:hypothetical protein TSAR_008917 [Trichomalopsis sarcophagae]|uniref:Uncharacterized protein n=1 Tax=Trichomalopsis sarcophagae TaxID=543379 RepID=A0A232F0M8_9HYME|nr:hypothetical protein TSAR_008917 [Trichomalopsis sarcophagae]